MTKSTAESTDRSAQAKAHRTRFANLALCLALLGAAAMAYYHEGLFVPRALESRASRDLNGGYSFGNDFYQIWLTSREWQRNRIYPYSEQATRDIQIGLYGRTLDPNRSGDPKDQRRFPYPAFVDLLFGPAALFSFPIVRIDILCLLIPLTAAGVWLWMKVLSWDFSWQWTSVVFLMVFTSYPALEGLYSDQIGLIVAFLLPASLLSLQRGRLRLSGILLALTLMKPQVTALAIIYLFFWSFGDLRRRGRLLVSFLATSVLLVGAALAVWPRWIQSWFQLLYAYRDYNPPPLFNLLLASLDVPHSVVPVLAACVVIAGIVLAWRKRRAAPDSAEFWLTLSALLAVTAIVVLAGQAVYDHIILLPGILLLASRWSEMSSSRWIQKTVTTLAAVVLFWPWVAAAAVIVLRPFLTYEQFHSRAIFYLPVDLAAVFPFLVLAPLLLALRKEKSIEATVSGRVSVSC